jgi:hypothetical protein
LEGDSEEEREVVVSGVIYERIAIGGRGSKEIKKRGRERNRNLVASQTQNILTFLKHQFDVVP